MKILYFTFVFVIREILALSVDFSIVKSIVKKHSNVELFCKYESDNLYTVKYYKDDQEFFRYTPSANHPVQLFLVPHVTVSLNESNSTKVKLLNVSYESAGVYKCAVTEHSLKTMEKKHKLHVGAVPYRFPELSTEQELYQLGDTLNATCVSGPTYPVPKLRFRLSFNDINSLNEVIDYQEELKIIKMSLVLVLNSSHFMDGKMYLECIASRDVYVDGIYEERTVILFEKNSTQKWEALDL